MTSSLFVKDETDAIDLGDGNVVHIRRRMAYAQQRALSSLKVGRDQSAFTREYLGEVLLQNIVRWEGPGFQNGTGPVQISRATIDALDPDIGTRLTNEIAVRNGVKPEDPLATSGPSSLPSSADTAEASRSSTPSSESASGSAGPGTS